MAWPYRRRPRWRVCRIPGSPAGRIPGFLRVAGWLLLAQWPPAALFAQWARPPDRGGMTRAIGQPPVWRWQAGAGAGAWFEGRDQVMVRAEAGVHRDLLSPTTGLAGLWLEGYVGATGSSADAGARALLRSAYLGGAAGAEYDARRKRVHLLVTLQSPVRRGGLFGAGTLARLNWYPLETHSFTLGVAAPLGQPLAGRGRPRRDHVVVAAERPAPIPYPVSDPDLGPALDSLRRSAEWVRRLVVPFMDHDGRSAAVARARFLHAMDSLRTHLAAWTAEDQVRHYHAQLARVFGIAAGDPVVGQTVAQQARAILLDEVILPYNALLGRKKRKDTLVELGIAARGAFARWLVTEAPVASPRVDQVLYAFQQVVHLLDEARRQAAREWDDPRLVWLPLQYALHPEEHDTADELDRLVERATGARYTGGNRIWYLANLQFHWELLRMIRETEDYHVLWIHDFPASNGAGGVDPAALEVVEAYLDALTDRVVAYDRTGRLPLYFILLDQHYYEARKSRLWMTLLEDPLAAPVRVPGGDAAATARLVRARDRLARAVAESRLLQAEARQYGEAWLRNRVRVHVSITNQADPSFWSGGLVSSVFGYPDNVMRDHRKIAFHDVTEADPERGMAVYTGMGVGQQYLGSGWEDRSLLARGPAQLDLVRAVRDLLLSQGMREEHLPWPFRPSPGGMAPAAAAADATAGRVMSLHNGTGFEPKPLNVAKAVLYSLLPSGSVVKVPDSLWNATFFASLLTGSSLRGVRVLIIAPGLANAPSAGFPQMARAWELFSHLLDARERLAAPIAEAGGLLEVGLYTLDVTGGPLADRARLWEHSLRTSPFLDKLMPFGVPLLPVVEAAGMADGEAIPPGGRERPKLHHKVQFMATGALWDLIARAPEWPEFMARYLEYRRVTFRLEGEYREARVMPEELAAIAGRMMARIAAEGDPAAAAWAIVGSQNQDYRGMFMDGEVGLLLTGADALVTLVDLVFLAGTVVWLEDHATLDRHLPPPGELLRRLARVAKDAV
jgi:hypothetical protein